MASAGNVSVSLKDALNDTDNSKNALSAAATQGSSGVGGNNGGIQKNYGVNGALAAANPYKAKKDANKKTFLISGALLLVAAYFAYKKWGK